MQNHRSEDSFSSFIVLFLDAQQLSQGIIRLSLRLWIPSEEIDPFRVSICLLSTFSSFSLAADFSADPSINAGAIYKDATVSFESRESIVPNYPASQGDTDNVHIQADWLNLTDVSVYHFLADMDVDCDGVDVSVACGNNDGQKETDFGALDARSVPWYVLPNKFYKDNGIKPNALGAIICDDKMYYGIFGNSNGAKPEVIGEALLLLANMCFPKDGLNRGKAKCNSMHEGHEPLDVLYIVFPTKFPSGVGKNAIDIDTLRLFWLTGLLHLRRGKSRFIPITLSLTFP
ncbi:fungal chitosanase of glycosyl hydrolase group 75-domain-containing protein [Armillaria fumosa]|nr:fungal chitosanase of glycosyl hydrolase group 75-domain-containing protein [Armillaria fumosa]